MSLLNCRPFSSSVPRVSCSSEWGEEMVWERSWVLKNLSDGVTLPPFYTHHVIKSEVSILIHLVDFPFACTFFASTFLPFLPRWPGARARSSGFPFIFQCLPDVWSCPLRRFVALRWVFFFLFLLLFLRVDLFLIWFFWFRFLFVFLSVLF